MEQSNSRADISGSRERSQSSLSSPIGFDPGRIAELRKLLRKASPLPWQEGWNTRYFGDGYQSMCGRGPDTIALPQTDSRYKELVADIALADAALIAAAVNALPELLDAIEGSGA